ncbi:MAG: hypothetical protein F6K18_33650, partial [Okeania sp. SIO2C2]|uniref:hypothetical protein n=1 Tax=Okeania sp. SIO2C2 TaxID=2607787 RepID=UPI0013BDD64A
RQETGYRRQETGDRRQDTGDRRQETGDRIQDTGDRRQETGDRRQETGDRRQETGDRRQETGVRKKFFGDFRVRIIDIIPTIRHLQKLKIKSTIIHQLSIISPCSLFPVPCSLFPVPSFLEMSIVLGENLPLIEFHISNQQRRLIQK